MFLCPKQKDKKNKKIFFKYLKGIIDLYTALASHHYPCSSFILWYLNKYQTILVVTENINGVVLCTYNE